MKWKGRQGSSNIEDRRGGGMGIGRRTGAGLGIGGMILFLVIYFLGGDLSMLGPSSPMAPQSTLTEEQEAELAEFVSVVLKDTEDVWAKVFEEEVGQPYQEPKLVLFTVQVESACGFASAAVGPFYCPVDRKVYIDLSFYQELRNRFGASGDFAMAYVVAHEVGHHVQNLLGISGEVNQLRRRLTKAEFNKISVQMELQADYLAGVWATNADQLKGILEEGDIQEALRCAEAIGDDMIQQRTQGRVVPESFTHGTSEQRQEWFYKGYKNGTISGGDTFRSPQLSLNLMAN